MNYRERPFSQSSLPNRICAGNLLIGYAVGKIDDVRDRQYTSGSVMITFHNDWNLIMEAVTQIEEDMGYFSNLSCVGIGVYEFSFSRYFKEEPDGLEYPDGYLARSDSRASSFDDVRLEAVWLACVEYAKYYLKQQGIDKIEYKP